MPDLDELREIAMLQLTAAQLHWQLEGHLEGSTVEDTEEEVRAAIAAHIAAADMMDEVGYMHPYLHRKAAYELQSLLPEPDDA